MMIKCNQHGFQLGVQISPDLEAAVNSKESLHGILILKYEYLEEIANVFYLSHSYASQYGIDQDTTLPLPDEYPDYINSTIMICKKCFLDCIGDEVNVL